MMTGVSEYDRETYLVFQEVQKKYLNSIKTTKTEIFEILKDIFGKAFAPAYVDNLSGRILAQSIYNEVFKLEEYEFSITTQKEFMKYIDGRDSDQTTV